MCVSIPFDEKIASDRQRNVVFHLPDIPLRESSVSADSALFDRAEPARSSYQHAQLLACLTRGSELHHRTRLAETPRMLCRGGSKPSFFGAGEVGGGTTATNRTLQPHTVTARQPAPSPLCASP